MTKHNIIYCSILFSLVIVSFTSIQTAHLTTLMDYDPTPIFNTANSYMPPNAHFHSYIKEQIKDSDDKASRKLMGFAVSPFFARSIRAKDDTGTLYGDAQSTDPVFLGMGNYAGTPFILGMFLGNDPNGNNIWSGNTVSTTVGNLQTNLNNTTWPKDFNDAFLQLKSYGTTSQNDEAESIFSAPYLNQDQLYFGAVSWPATYQKLGLRFEFNFDFFKNLGMYVQGGVGNLKYATLSYPGLTQATATNATSPTAYLSDLSTNINDAYGTTNNPLPVISQWIDSNYIDLLESVGYSTKNFEEIRFEDLRAHIFVRHAFDMHPPIHNKHKWNRMIFTPYLIAGLSLPTGHEKNYTQLQSLAFGNNGHSSVGATGGFMFDFEDTIEIGAELGITAFFENKFNNVPVPTHEQQRVVYPFRTNIVVQPGYNWHTAVTMNAYEFVNNVNFYFKYVFVTHTKDTISLQKANGNFLPHVLENQSEWSSQLITTALDFAVHNMIHMGVAWQLSIDQKNARAPQTVMASVNFMF
jgi:hypothetical protein